MAAVEYKLPPGCMGLPLDLVKQPCIAGVDIRPGSWDLLVCDMPRSRVTQLPVLRPMFVGKVRDEFDVLFVLRQYRVLLCVVDTRPETTLAKRMQEEAERYGIEVWRAEYNTSPGAIEITRNEPEKLVRLDRTIVLDGVQHCFQTGQGAILPQNFKDLSLGRFHVEMCNMTRIYRNWHGKDSYAWEKQGDDHSMHAWGLLRTAMKLSGLFGMLSEDSILGRGIVTGTLNQNLAIGDGIDGEDRPSIQELIEAECEADSSGATRFDSGVGSFV